MKTLGVVFAIITTTLGAQQSYQYDFTQSRLQPGWTRVEAGKVFSKKSGYGFETGAKIIGTAGATSETPFLFSVKLPESNFNVTVMLDNPSGKAITTVKAE